ncbi:MAG: hypothetical protein AB8E87_03940 [Prochlorococcus sp.]
MFVLVRLQQHSCRVELQSREAAFSPWLNSANHQHNSASPQLSIPAPDPNTNTNPNTNANTDC